ncbi:MULTISPECIES: phage major tail tube protein [unclassified Megasphaera]|jgi:P2 family phage contractile tail tube protein|uniref:phage major tail tube protein n=1 Tax=unclassified Megasphaera TaxID=2626256 RepID=UPI000ECBB59D|nr:phage major tail tube protein [Megasphaera sp. UBA4233]MCI7200891.1 phage major tail tube protein [Megasphaera elsdenii]UVY42061.1 MAG: tail tube protein FII [Bacteriophage sp.]DAQ82816.1 MAG TPA: tail tube protein [Caudoviricetes sp.]HAM04145.1 phage tail protein [Megasphaera sp.]DAV50958.1 MAG TPA: tail tube protein [Caudoviricetes sp.]
MAVNKIPEVINDMRAYIDGADDLIGVNEVELPDLKSLTEDIEGIGVAGKIEAPIAGHFDSLELKMTWQVPTKTSSRLVGGSTLALELYSDIQNWDSGANDYEHEQYRVAVRGRVKSHNPGKFKAGSKTDSETVIECTYFKIEMGGATLCEIDKYGYKAIVNGIDLLQQVRANIGMN